MAAFLPDTDSEDELPPGWEERATLDGKVYYANHVTKSTQWSHPRTGKKKSVAGELPHGWERKVSEDGNVFYVDHINKKTTYTDPRLAFAVEEKDSPTDIRQRFDASTHALQILHGRDLGGKVAIITGANCGIGYETARALAYHGCEVIFACRSREKATDAMNIIRKERPNSNAHYFHLDLANLTSIEKFCEKLKREKKPIHMLILNAGAFGLPHSLTEDGFEMTFQVNHLGHFYLVKLLTPILIESAPCRVVVLSSESHRFSFLNKENISEERLSPKSSSGFISLFAYNDSKLCNILFSNELNRRLSKHKVYSNAVHPGNVVSSYLSRNWWFYRLIFAIVRPFTKSLIFMVLNNMNQNRHELMMNYLAKHIYSKENTNSSDKSQAASTSVYCAAAHELEGVGGMYFNNCYRCKPSAASDDEILAKTLWEISENMIARARENKVDVKEELT